TAGDVVRTVIAMSDDPDDPATWLLDELAGASSAAKSVLDPLRPELDALLNSLLSELSQQIVVDGVTLDLVCAIRVVANAVGAAASRFGVKSTLAVSMGPNGGLVGKHTLTGVFFRVDGKRVDKTLAELNLDDIVVDQIPITLTSDSQLLIADEDISI